MRLAADLTIMDRLDALVARLADPADDDVWTDLLGDDVDATKLARWKAATRRDLPTVKGGFPRTDDKWPLWSVILLAMGPEAEFLGKQGEFEVVEGEDRQTYSVVAEQHIDIIISTKNPQLTAVFAVLVLNWLTTSRDEFIDAGYDGFGFQGAGDVEPSALYLPNDVFARSISWSLTSAGTALKREPSRVVTAVYVGAQGTDQGDGHTGQVVPVTGG